MRAPFFLLVASTCGVLALAACKDDPKRPPVANGGDSVYPGSSISGGGIATDGGHSDSGITADSGDAGECSDLDDTTAAEVQQNAVLDDMPAGQGGVILDGTYDLIEARVYISSGVPGLTNTTIKGLIRITGTTFERITTVRIGTNAETTSAVSGTISSSDTNATIALSCPTPAQEPVTYSVLNNTLTLSHFSTHESFVYRKQL